MKTLDFGGYRVRYVASGHGTPMVFLHNGGSSHHIWDRQLSHFSRDHRVVVLDMLGFGQSDCPLIPYTVEMYAKQLAALLAAEKLERPILWATASAARPCWSTASSIRASRGPSSCSTSAAGSQ